LGWWPLVSSVASSSSTPPRGVQGRWVVKERWLPWCCCVLCCRLACLEATATSWASLRGIPSIFDVQKESCLDKSQVRHVRKLPVHFHLSVQLSSCLEEGEDKHVSVSQQHCSPNCTEEGVSPRAALGATPPPPKQDNTTKQQQCSSITSRNKHAHRRCLPLPAAAFLPLSAS